jgi:hypothetical protein
MPGVAEVTRRYSRRTLDALLRHLAEPGNSTRTYLASHPRVSQAQIDAIFEDLRAAVDRRAAPPSSRVRQPGAGSSGD